MDANLIIQLISTFGFPIVMCGVMAWYVKYITDKHRDEVSQLNASHKAEMDGVKDAISNNTLALQKLCDLLESQKG